MGRRDAAAALAKVTKERNRGLCTKSVIHSPRSRTDAAADNEKIAINQTKRRRVGEGANVFYLAPL